MITAQTPAQKLLFTFVSANNPEAMRLHLQHGNDAIEDLEAAFVFATENGRNDLAQIVYLKVPADTRLLWSVKNDQGEVISKLLDDTTLTADGINTALKLLLRKIPLTSPLKEYGQDSDVTIYKAAGLSDQVDLEASWHGTSLSLKKADLQPADLIRLDQIRIPMAKLLAADQRASSENLKKFLDIGVWREDISIADVALEGSRIGSQDIDDQLGITVLRQRPAFLSRILASPHITEEGLMVALGWATNQNVQGVGPTELAMLSTLLADYRVTAENRNYAMEQVCEHNSKKERAVEILVEDPSVTAEGLELALVWTALHGDHYLPLMEKIIQNSRVTTQMRKTAFDALLFPEIDKAAEILSAALKSDQTVRILEGNQPLLPRKGVMLANLVRRDFGLPDIAP
jgi:hypothetical protein